MNTNKYLEYYLDSKIYTNEEVQKSIDETKKEFPNKNVKVSVYLNESGVYIVTFEFENKNTFFNRIKIKCERKQRNKSSGDWRRNYRCSVCCDRTDLFGCHETRFTSDSGK